MSEHAMPDRTRTITWEDPAMARGDLPGPPIMSLMNIMIGDIEEGRIVFLVQPAEYHYNPIGTVHGGLACMLADSAMACAIHSTLPAGVGCTTLELKVNYLRPLTVKTGWVACEGKVIHVGRRIATAEARITDAAGKLYAHATTTCMIFRSVSEPKQP
jgi:uncharacterized protein (TIGR00369 family)